MRRNDVASTSVRRHVHTRFLINQCQIITILILKSDNIENSRIELKGVVLPVPSNQILPTPMSKTIEFLIHLSELNHIPRIKRFEILVYMLTDNFIHFVGCKPKFCNRCPPNGTIQQAGA